MGAKKYLIIGGNSGIGLEIVKALHRKGSKLFVGSRSKDQLDGLDGLEHLPLDVTSEQLDLAGLPDVLNGMVYCPGTIRLKPFQRLTIDEFLEDLQINFLGAVKCLQTALPRLKKSSTGASIVLFSTVAVNTGMPFHASIASAKAAVEGLTRSLAAELAPRIRVNAIAPSLTDTPLASVLLSGDEKRKASADRHPLKRVGNPKEIGYLAVHLLLDESSWITGQVIHADGGMSTLRTFK